jgi:apolipoprotein N-acyltransferase
MEHGGQLLVVQTSNAMFIHTAQIDQQFAISRLRALETHRFVVVAAINGLTGVIAPDGSVVTTTPARTRSYAEATLGLYDAVTPAVRIGPWLGRLCLGLVVLGWALALGRYRRNRRPTEQSAATAPLTDRTSA